MDRPASVDFTPAEAALLSGDEGEALQFAMEVVVRAAEMMGAERLIEVNYLHIDACHYYGEAHLDFARRFVEGGLRFQIPAWTNTVPASLIPEQETRDGADPKTLENARELARLYVELGANPG